MERTSGATVAVIGAGQAGLTAVKALRDRGVDVTVFEKTDRVGGNWAFGNGHSSAYRSLHIDTAKNALAFEDLPMPEEWPDFLHHTQVAEYLERYARMFDLHQDIRLHTPVHRAERRDGGGWRLEVGDGEDAEFDYLVVANGHHWDPRWPDPPFPGRFDGDAIHSHYYRSPTEPLDLRGRRVLVVGIGNSAADIASELSQRTVCDQAFISTRSGAWVLPLTMFGRTLDEIVKPIPGMSLKMQRRLAHTVLSRLIGDPESYGLPRPDHRILEAHPTASQELLWRLRSGDLIAKPNIQRLEGDHVRFEDGSRERIDAIIYATGYRVNFPFFDPEFISAPGNRLPLFKRVFKPGIADLAFIGLCQPIPTLFPFCERQSRWVAEHVDGGYRLPDPEEMERIIAHDEEVQTAHFTNRPRHTMQADMHAYLRDLDREIRKGRRRAKRVGPDVHGRAPAVAAVA